MKTNFFAALCAALFWAAGCATPSALHEADGGNEVVTHRAEITAHGLSCPLCASNLDDQMARVPGVKSSRIDFETGVLHVEVEAGAEVPRASLLRAVRDAGFTPRDFRLVEDAP